MRRSILFLFLIAIAATSCYYDNAEELYQYNQNNSNGCDTLNVTYTVQIKPFFDSKCTSCHSQGSTFPALDNFSDAHTYAITPGNLLYAKVSTNHKSTNPDACEIAQVKKWVDTGAN
jgi:hypothetical protein